MHIKLPNLSKHRDELNSVIDKYFLQIRGIHGEHSKYATEDTGMLDVSNKRRLGRSEKELVQDLVHGVHALLKAEKEVALDEITTKEQLT